MPGREASRAHRLIVDDAPDTARDERGGAARSLRRRVRGNVRGGLGRVRERVSDAIVVDVMLGGESGWELIRALQGDPRCRAAPIVVLSARAQFEPPPGLRPCAAYVRKP